MHADGVITASVSENLERASFPCSVSLYNTNGIGDQVQIRWAAVHNRIHVSPKDAEGPKTLLRCVADTITNHLVGENKEPVS